MKSFSFLLFFSFNAEKQIIITKEYAYEQINKILSLWVRLHISDMNNRIHVRRKNVSEHGVGGWERHQSNSQPGFVFHTSIIYEHYNCVSHIFYVPCFSLCHEMRTGSILQLKWFYQLILTFQIFFCIAFNTINSCNSAIISIICS